MVLKAICSISIKKEKKNRVLLEIKKVILEVVACSASGKQNSFW